jgi:hypothetical protein
MVGADVGAGAYLSTCHRNQNSCEDQTQHRASGTTEIRKMTKFRKIYEASLSSRCQKVEMKQIPH